MLPTLPCCLTPCLSRRAGAGCLRLGLGALRGWVLRLLPPGAELEKGRGEGIGGLRGCGFGGDPPMGHPIYPHGHSAPWCSAGSWALLVSCQGRVSGCRCHPARGCSPLRTSWPRMGPAAVTVAPQPPCAKGEHPAVPGTVCAHVPTAPVLPSSSLVEPGMWDQGLGLGPGIEVGDQRLGSGTRGWGWDPASLSCPCHRPFASALAQAPTWPRCTAWRSTAPSSPCSPPPTPVRTVRRRRTGTTASGSASTVPWG